MVCVISILFYFFSFFFSSRRRHTRCALVTGVQTCALPIWCQWRRRRSAIMPSAARILQGGCLTYRPPATRNSGTEHAHTLITGGQRIFWLVPDAVPAYHSALCAVPECATFWSGPGGR